MGDIYVLLIQYDMVRYEGPAIGQFEFIAIKHVPYVTHLALRMSRDCLIEYAISWTFYKGTNQLNPSYNFEPCKHLSGCLRKLAIFSLHSSCFKHITH